MLPTGIKYDPVKEEKQLMEAKQQELKRIEEAKQKVVDQGKENCGISINQHGEVLNIHPHRIFSLEALLTNVREYYYIRYFDVACVILSIGGEILLGRNLR